MALTVGTTNGPAAEKLAFDLPADSAKKSLRRFSTQADIALVFPSEITRDVRTQAVRGLFPPREALDRLLAHSGLIATESKKASAIVFTP